MKQGRKRDPHRAVGRPACGTWLPQNGEPSARQFGARTDRRSTQLLDMRVIFVGHVCRGRPGGPRGEEGTRMPAVSPCLIQLRRMLPATLVVSLGVPVLDEYLEFLSGRCRPNTVLAVAYDLKVFFTVVGKSPEAGPSGGCARVYDCSTERSWLCQRSAVQAVDDERVGVSTRTLRRRLSSGLGSVRVLACARRRGDQPGAAWSADPPGTTPTSDRAFRWSAGPGLCRGSSRRSEVDALTSALRTHRDRAMVAAMVLGGLRRCEVIGLRLCRSADGRATGVHRRG